jgi:alkyldihydroxyacetonephosphate synthase
MNQWIRWPLEENRDAALAEPAWRWLAQALGMPALLATPARDPDGMTLEASRLDPANVEKFAALLGAMRVRQDDGTRLRHAGGHGAADVLRRRGGDLSRAPDAVLYPRHEDDVLALLRLCAQGDIAVTPFGKGHGAAAMAMRGNHAALVSLDLSRMDRLLSVDAVSGLAQAEAGITDTALARQLATHGMALVGEPFATLGGWIAQHPPSGWLQDVRLATPQGIAVGLAPIAAGSHGRLGVITRASLRIRALPAHSEQRRYLFVDFASGLAATRQAQRENIPHAGLRLSDGDETRFHRAMARAGQRQGLKEGLTTRLHDIYLEMRRFDARAAQLVIRFDGSRKDVAAARRRFDALAKRLGALAQGVCEGENFDYHKALLDRGVTLDTFCATASWARLPALYAAVRGAADRAMRAHAPRDGAHGILLCHAGAARADGADLDFTLVYPRDLGDAVAQALAIRQAVLSVLAAQMEMGPADAAALAALKQALDPGGILSPQDSA